MILLDLNDNIIENGKLNALIEQVPQALATSGGTRAFGFKIKALRDVYNVVCFISSGTRSISQFSLSYNGANFKKDEKAELASFKKDEMKTLELKQEIPTNYSFQQSDYLVLSIEWDE